MICSEYHDINYYVESLITGSLGFIYDKEDNDLQSVKVVSVISEKSDPKTYKYWYNDLNPTEKNDFLNAEYSCEFIIEGSGVIIGFNPLTAEDLDRVVTYHC